MAHAEQGDLTASLRQRLEDASLRDPTAAAFAAACASWSSAAPPAGTQAAVRRYAPPVSLSARQPSQAPQPSLLPPPATRPAQASLLPPGFSGQPHAAQSAARGAPRAAAPRAEADPLAPPAPAALPASAARAPLAQAQRPGGRSLFVWHANTSQLNGRPAQPAPQPRLRPPAKLAAAPPQPTAAPSPAGEDDAADEAAYVARVVAFLHTRQGGQCLLTQLGDRTGCPLPQSLKQRGLRPVLLSHADVLELGVDPTHPERRFVRLRQGAGNPTVQPPPQQPQQQPQPAGSAEEAAWVAQVLAYLRGWPNPSEKVLLTKVGYDCPKPAVLRDRKSKLVLGSHRELEICEEPPGTDRWLVGLRTEPTATPPPPPPPPPLRAADAPVAAPSGSALRHQRHQHQLPFDEEAFVARLVEFLTAQPGQRYRIQQLLERFRVPDGAARRGKALLDRHPQAVRLFEDPPGSAGHGGSYWVGLAGAGAPAA